MPGNYLLQGLGRGECLPGKSWEPNTSCFAAVPKAIANNRLRHTRGGRTGFAARRKFGTHLPPQVGRCRIPAIFLPCISPNPSFLEAAPLLDSFEVLHVKKLPEDGILTSFSRLF